MTKQEEIRRIIDAYTDDECLYPDASCESRSGHGFCRSYEGSYKCLIKNLDELGVVIKVDKPLPLPSLDVFTTGVIKLSKADLDKVGYVAVEPLIKEE